MTGPAGNSLRRIRRHSLFLFLLAGTVLVPLGVVGASLFSPASEIWIHIRSTLLGSYIGQTILLAGGTLAAASVIGTAAAWVCVRYDFPLKGFFNIALVIPLALPAYVAAFAWSGIFDYSGPWQLFFRNILNRSDGYPVPDIVSLPGAIGIMTLALYPYIFLPLRSTFKRQGGSIYEAARVLGAGEARLFFRIALPMARPALTGGGVLVLMEVLNEYGAVHYFGINTLSVGIFRAWFSLGDLNAAMKLASVLLMLVALLLISEKFLRGSRGYANLVPRPIKPLSLGGPAAGIALLICAVPVLFGFLIPVAQLVAWALQAEQSLFDPRFLKQILNTLLLTAGATLLILSAALISGHLLRRPALKGKNMLASTMTLGYAIPGAVIAIGVMTSAGYIDSGLNGIAARYLSAGGRLFLSGSIGALTAAYLVRYLGVAFNPVEAGFTQVSGRFREASRNLGKSSLGSLIKIELPLLKPALQAAAIMTAIDLLKELPLTLVLRPFNFETLATRAYEMAGDERLEMAALPSLVIVAIGLIPVLLWTRKKPTRSIA